MLPTTCLLVILFGASGVVWEEIVSNWRQRKPILRSNDDRRATWNSLPELIIAVLVLLWTVLHVLSRLSERPESQSAEIDLHQVMNQAFVNFGLTLILPLVLASGQGSWSGIGMTLSNLRDQIRTGFKGFFASVIPMTMAMVVTVPFRPPEGQNSLLKLLQNSPDTQTISLVALTAILSAPLVEELLFRVILQSWLATLFPAPQAITVVAVVFGLVHGWRDGLALLPLAFILGYVFHRCHSYLAVVMIHALFNATMLVLQLLNPQVP